MILSTTNFSSERLGCKGDLTYKWVENLIKKQVENLIKISLNSILQVSFSNHTVKNETIPSTIDNLQGTSILS